MQDLSEVLRTQYPSGQRSKVTEGSGLSQSGLVCLSSWWQQILDSCSSSAWFSGSAAGLDPLGSGPVFSSDPDTEPELILSAGTFKTEEVPPVTKTFCSSHVGAQTADATSSSSSSSSDAICWKCLQFEFLEL